MTFMHRFSLGSARKQALTCINVAKNYKAFFTSQAFINLKLMCGLQFIPMTDTRIMYIEPDKLIGINDN